VEELKKSDTSELDSPATLFPEPSFTPKTNVYPNSDRLFSWEEAETTPDEEHAVPRP